MNQALIPSLQKVQAAMTVYLQWANRTVYNKQGSTSKRKIKPLDITSPADF